MTHHKNVLQFVYIWLFLCFHENSKQTGNDVLVIDEFRPIDVNWLLQQTNYGISQSYVIKMIPYSEFEVFARFMFLTTIHSWVDIGSDGFVIANAQQL